MQENRAEFYLYATYGKERYYPANIQAERLTLLARRKTLDEADLILLKALGFEVGIIPKPELEKSPTD